MMKMTKVPYCQIILTTILVLFTLSLFQCRRSEKPSVSAEMQDIVFALPEEPPIPLRVDVSFPNSDISLNPNIIISFNKPILDDNNNILIKEPFFEMDPSLLAERIAISANHIEYELSRDIKPEKLFKLTLNKSIKIGDTDYPLEQDRGYYLRTSSPALVKDAYITNINKKNNLFSLVIEFNFTISPKFLAEKIFIKTSEGTQIPYVIESFKETSVHLRVSNPPFDLQSYSQPLYIHVSKGVQSLFYEDMNLRADFIKAVNIPASTTLMFYNYNIQEAGDKYNLILNFSDIIDEENLRSFISIKPDIITDIKVNYYSVIIEGDFTPNAAVTLDIKPGLLSRNNNLLLNGISQQIRFRNFSQMVGFDEKGSFIRRDGKKTLKFSYRNTKAINIEVYKIFQNNIPVLFNFYKGWTGDLEAPDSRIAVKIAEKKLDMEFVPNEKHTYYLNFSALLDKNADIIDNGFYHILIRSDDAYYARDSMWLCVTDIGLITRLTGDKLFAWAISLDSGNPLNNVEVSLYSLNNQELDMQKSDRDGKVVFRGLSEYTEEIGIPFIVFAEKGKDFSFIDIYSESIDLTEYQTHGAPIIEDGYSAYFFTDRGIYRPGDILNFGGIVRNRNLNKFTTIKDVPVKMEIRDSSHRIVTTVTNPLDDHGTVEYQWDTSDYQETGFYSALFLIGNVSIGSLSVQVEEFIPQKIQTLLSSNRKEFSTKDSIELTLKGLYLFGAPVSKGSYTIYGYISPSVLSIKGQRDYAFGYSDFEDIRPVEIFRISGNLDDQGIAEISLDLSKYGINQYSKLDIKAEIAEQVSGRSVEEFISVFVNPYEIYLGLNKQDIDNIQARQVNTVRGIVLTDEGDLVKDPRDIEISIFHINYRYVYYYDSYYGRHRYRFEKIENLIKKEELSSKDGGFAFSFNPADYWGAYKIIARDLQSGSATESTKYPWWWGYGTKIEKNKAPYYIDLILDKNNAVPGERIELVLNSPFNGNLLLTAESNDVLLSEWHKVTKGHNTIKFRIPPKAKDYSNIYISAFIVNSEYTHGSVPLRALGIANIDINHEDYRLQLETNHAEIIKPNSDLEIRYTIKNHRENGRIALIAVDEGILQITKFLTPDPYGFFFRKTALGVTLNDILGMIMPEFSELYTGRTGYGDFEEEAMVRLEGERGRILRVKPLAFWSGFRDFGKDGKGSITFSVPNFLGKMRIMAVAVSNDKFGSSESFAIVKDKIQIITTLPRFLLVGDSFEIPITVINSTGKDGEFAIDIISENISVTDFEFNTDKIFIGNDESVTAYVKAKPLGNLGHSSIKIIARGNNEETFTETTIPILPNSPAHTEYHLITCGEGDTSLNSYTEGWQPEFERTFITLTSLIYSKELGYLRYLVRYPYGCLEQTISTAFPLLYLKDIDRVKEINEYLEDQDINNLILSAISKVLSMRIGDGGFGMWPSSDEPDLWLTIYSAHFLFEADDRGFLIDQSVFNSLSNYIINAVNIENNSIYSINTRAYAFYVLSLMKKARENDIDFFLQRYRDRLLGESIAFIAGAYAGLGNIQKANEIISENLEFEKGVKLPEGTDSSDLQSFFYSELRQKGIILNILMDMEQFADETLKNQLLLKIIEDLKSRSHVWYYSTQELVWSLRALVKLTEKAPHDAVYEGYLYKDNKEILTFSKEQKTAWGSGLTGHDLKIVNKGSDPFYCVMTIEGIKPGIGYTRYAQGIEIKRVFYDENGNLLNQQDMLELRQGQDIWAKITIIAQSRYKNAAIIDRIGAGFEIENPRITKQVLPGWINQDAVYNPVHIDIKDHQIGFFGDINPGMQTTIYYKLRALTKGSFLIPPVTVEVMYDPITRASDSTMNSRIN